MPSFYFSTFETNEIGLKVILCKKPDFMTKNHTETNSIIRDWSVALG